MFFITPVENSNRNANICIKLVLNFSHLPLSTLMKAVLQMPLQNILYVNMIFTYYVNPQYLWMS